jgi:hypothetical protein
VIIFELINHPLLMRALWNMQLKYRMLQKLKLNIYLKMSEFVKYIFLTYRNAEIEYLGCQNAEDYKRQTRK